MLCYCMLRAYVSAVSVRYSVELNTRSLADWNLEFQTPCLVRVPVPGVLPSSVSPHVLVVVSLFALRHPYCSLGCMAKKSYHWSHAVTGELVVTSDDNDGTIHTVTEFCINEFQPLLFFSRVYFWIRWR